MRVAHVLAGWPDPDGPTGVFKSVYHLSRAQAALGQEVAIFGLAERAPAAVEGVRAATYPPGRLPFGLPRAFLRDLRAWRPDVVHMHSAYVPAHATLAWLLRRWGIPYVVAPRGALSRHVLDRRPYLKRPYRRLFELPSLNGAAFVHAIADEADIRAYGVRAPVVTAPNAIDPASLPRELDGGLLAARWPALLGRTIALFLGRLDPLHKGLDLLLEGASAATCRDAMAVVLVGPDWRGSRGWLEARARSLGIAERVLFWGAAYGKEKYDLLASADLFVHPSRWEAGLPHAVMEALACGKPCLVTPPADPAGLVAGYGAGVVVSTAPREIAAGLTALVEAGAESRACMGRQARRLVERELSWERAARILEAAYRRIGAEP